MSYNFNFNDFNKDTVSKLEISSHRSLVTPLSSIPSAELKIEKSFSKMKEVIDDGIHDRLDPAIYIFGASCGAGKTTGAGKAIKLWKETGFAGGNGIIIAVSTIEEIDPFRIACGLENSDFACFTSDAEKNAWGRGREDASNAAVLFTTHKMIEQRSKGKDSFTDISEFHYRGNSRCFIIWDEAIARAAPITIPLRTLMAIPDKLEGNSPAFTSAIMSIISYDHGEGKTFLIHQSIGQLAFDAIKSNDMLLKGKYKNAVENLAAAAGQEVVLRKDNYHGTVLVGKGRPLLGDMPPMMVLDASASFNAGYTIWAESSGRVVRLPYAQASYERLRIHWWDKGAAKSTLKNDPNVVHEIATAAADCINAKVGEDWLVIHTMKQPATDNSPGFSIEDRLAEKLTDKSRVSFLHWGRHRSNNAYRHIRNVLIIGTLDYGNTVYEAMHLAASDLPVGTNDLQAIKSIRDGVFQDNLYQAVGRCNVRNIVGGLTGDATVHLITGRKGGREALVEAAFPNCTITPWMPIPPKPLKKDQIIMDQSIRLFDHEGQDEVPQMTLARMCGGKDSTYLYRNLRRPLMKDFLRSKAIRIEGNKLVKVTLPSVTSP